MAGLPDDQRAALVLTQFGDVSHAEIARALGCPREKVKALVFQARDSLATARVARDTPCAEIREQLATRHGGALRRTVLRRHLRECKGCRGFRDSVRAQRRNLRLLLPLAPVGGLKRALISTLFGPGGGVTGGAAVSAGGLTGTGLVATALATVAIPAPPPSRWPWPHPATRANRRTKYRRQQESPSHQRLRLHQHNAWLQAVPVRWTPPSVAPASRNRDDNDPLASPKSAVPDRAAQASSRTEADAARTSQSSRAVRAPKRQPGAQPGRTTERAPSDAAAQAVARQ